MINGTIRKSNYERSRYYEFEPGDSTRYTFVITDMFSPEAKSIVGGVTEDYKLVTVLSPTVISAYPFDFSFKLDDPGRIGYIGTKFGVNQHIAEMIAHLLEYIRSEEK